MRPTMQEYTLIEKIQLTKDVYELSFEAAEALKVKPGQFITFMLPGLGARSYSLLDVNKNKYSFIIKKIAIEDGGRGGSVYICEREIGEKLKGIGPSGNFVIQENHFDKLFLGTGTGFVPLYYQLKYLIDNNFGGKYKFIFGVRTSQDLFYIDELNKLKENYEDLDYEIYLSREDSPLHKKGYIIDEIQDAHNDFEEVYICGSPKMVESAKAKLLEYNFPEEKIYEEKY